MPVEPRPNETDAPAPDGQKILVTHKKVIEPDTTAPKPTESPSAPEPGAGESNQEKEMINELAQQAADRKQAAAQSKAETEQQQKIDKLVEDKTYFVPIKQTGKQWGVKILVLVGFLIFIAVFLATMTLMFKK